MEKKTKQYQKPLVEKINLRVTESVLTACKTSLSAVQPKHNAPGNICTASPACKNDAGS
jgi:hypothetical protein